MSSVDKNFDTLMERAFAETLNLRLRIPYLTMGEVYILPIEELDDQAMNLNSIAFKSRKVNVGKFIRTFNAFSGRDGVEIDDQYKYDASALVLIDLREIPPKIISSSSDLANYDYPKSVVEQFSHICAENFDDRLISNYKKFQAKAGL